MEGPQQVLALSARTGVRPAVSTQRYTGDVNTYKKPRDELLANLCEQLEFLRASSAAFDAGTEAEAMRLATTIRVLLYDAKRSRGKSLLVQLGMKQRLRYLDTTHHELLNSRNLLPYLGLVGMRLDAPEGTAPARMSFTLVGVAEEYDEGPPGAPKATGTFVPRVNLDGGGAPHEDREVAFRQWWASTVIRDADDRRFSRGDLILAMANREGGAHVDPTLDEAYAKLARMNSMAWRVESATGAVTPPENTPVAPSIRQMAHEVLGSVQSAFPDLCAS